MSRALRVGLLVAAALAAFGIGIFWIGSQETRLEPTYGLNAYFQNVAGLPEGAEVRVGGIHKGTVRHIFLPQRPDEKIRVEMALEDSTRNVIKKDSVAAIRAEGLVGDQYIEISFGTVGAPSVHNGDTIGSEAPLQVAEMMKKTDAILDSAQEAMQSLDQTVNNLNAITSSVNQGKGTMGELVNDKSVYREMDKAVSNLSEDTEALKHNFLLRGYFKKRGYEDPSALTRNMIQRMPPGTPTKRFTFPGAKAFGKSDSAELKDAKMLAEAGHFLETKGHGLVVIACYADAKGDSEQDRELTEARAAVVREYLVQHFKVVDDAEVKTIGMGKSGSAPDGGEVDILAYPAGTEK